ncbi:hypothetical protein [Streptomyces sp. NPDC057686]|uniref:hypothetical protein n=1 Tax=Streptomyces sp. NPDC057686 TaxID=3346212 RepID=UPI0036C70C52
MPITSVPVSAYRSTNARRVAAACAASVSASPATSGSMNCTGWCEVTGDHGTFRTGFDDDLARGLSGSGFQAHAVAHPVIGSGEVDETQRWAHTTVSIDSGG